MKASYETMCFACGENNPIGLKLKFTEDGEVYRTSFIPGEYHQSYEGILHGGLMCTVLDEVMGRYLWFKGMVAPTVDLQVRFRHPARVNEELLIEGQIINTKRRLIEMKATARKVDGAVVAEATGKFMVVKEEKACI